MISRIINVLIRRIPTCRYIAAVFGVLYGSAFHIADNAADIVSTFNVQTVINYLYVFNRFSIYYGRITNGRIYGITN